MTNIAMENPRKKWWFLAGKIIYKWAIFHGYVKLPEGMKIGCVISEDECQTIIYNGISIFNDVLIDN